MKLTANDLAEGFYRAKDLMKLKIISSRSDLKDKQDDQGFPKPLKPSSKVALFAKVEVHNWLMALVEKRDAKTIEPIQPPLAEARDIQPLAEKRDDIQPLVGKRDAKTVQTLAGKRDAKNVQTTDA